MPEPLRIVSLSDIHGNLNAFQKALEVLPFLDFDCIVLAGDLGDEEAARTIAYELSLYQCPLFYVRGNWDDYDFQKALHPDAVHLHLKHVSLAGWHFLGYSGSEADFFLGHPTLGDALERYNRLPENRRGSYYQFCRRQIRRELADYVRQHGLDERRIVLVSHERIYRLPFSPALYIFGHNHRPRVTRRGGTVFLNTAAIEMASPFNDLPPSGPGNLCLTTLSESDCQVEFRAVPSPYVCIEMEKRGYYRLIVKDTGEDAGYFFRDPAEQVTSSPISDGVHPTPMAW